MGDFDRGLREMYSHLNEDVISKQNFKILDSNFIAFCWDRAQNETPELWKELVSLEYVLTWGYSDDLKKDEKRYKELQDIIYRNE